MAKKLLATGYRIDRNNNSIFLEGNVLHQRLLLITDVTLNRILYNFADEGSGLISITYDGDMDETELILRQSLSNLNVLDTDTLQVLIEEESTSFRPEDPFLDPVSKLRVSQPENLIDTDFEYGLQSTKWETLKLVNNIPSFYSKNGVSSVVVTSVQSTVQDNKVIVTAPSHGLAVGSPFEITGLSNSQFEGGYIVTTIISPDQFSYQLPFRSLVTQELATVYTNILPGAFYFGSQITVVDITTNGLPESHLTVQTRYPHGFSLNTPFYFLNTVAVFRQDIPVAEFNIDDTVTNDVSTTTESVGESVNDYRISSVTPYNFIGRNTRYLNSANAVIDTYVPISSVRVTSGGAGYQQDPVVLPKGINTGTTSQTSYEIAWNASTGVALATDIITTAANNFQTGDRIEYFGPATANTAVSSGVISGNSLVDDLTGADFYTGVTNTNGRGFVATMITTSATFNGAALSATTATMSIPEINVDPNLSLPQIGMAIQLRVGANYILPDGTRISNVSLSSGTYTLSLEFPAPLAAAINATLPGAAFATGIDPIDNTFYAKSHGFETGDYMNYIFTAATGGTGNFPASSVGPTGLTSGTRYNVIKLDDDRFRIATTRENAHRGIPVDITTIGFPTQTGGQNVVPGIKFLGQNKSIYYRRISATTGTLHPTQADALSNTNILNFTSAGTAVAHNLSAARAVLAPTRTGNQVSSISVVSGGNTYEKNSAVTILAKQTVRSIQSTNNGGGYANGTTNVLRFKTQEWDSPIYVGMRVTGTGIPANFSVQSINDDPVNPGYQSISINGNINANISVGSLLTFEDPAGTSAVAVPNVRTQCLYYPSHNYAIGDVVYFAAPPNPVGVTGTQFYGGLAESRAYYVYPIDSDYFALVTAFPSTGFTVATSNSRVAITTTGTVYLDRKFMMTSAARVTSVASNIINWTSPTPISLVNGDTIVISSASAGTDTIGLLPANSVSSAVGASYDNGLHRVFYIVNSNQNGLAQSGAIQISQTPNGAIQTLGAMTGNVLLVPAVVIPEADSIYSPNHGFQNDDFVTYTSTGAAISGLNAQIGTNGYLINRISDNRFKLKTTAGVIVDLKNFGSGSHAFSNTKYDEYANVINKVGHGFNTGDEVIYDADGNPIIDGLVSNGVYVIKKVSDDAFRVSAASNSSDNKITRVAKVAANATITVEFQINHGLSVGDSIIIRDNPNPYMNNYWTVASVPATPTVNGSPSSITITVPYFIDSSPAVTQNAVAGTFYGIGYKYVNFKYVTANNALITPAAVGNTFTTFQAFDSQIVKETPAVQGGSIVSALRTRQSTVLPTGSFVDTVSGTSIRKAKIYFNRAIIDTISRASDVVTVTTVSPHGYADEQTVTIVGVSDETFNTGDVPVTITLIDSTSFSFSQVGADATVQGTSLSHVDMALTAAQAALFNANGVDSTSTTTLSLQAAASGASSLTLRAAASTAISSVSKTLVANAGLIGQTTLTVPDLVGIKPGNPVSGAGINVAAKVKSIISDTVPYQIELTHPHTANTTATAYLFYQIQVGQKVVATVPHDAETVRTTTASATNFRLVATTAPANAKVGQYVTGNRATTTFAADADPDTTTFEVPTTDNVYTVPRIEQTRYDGPAPFTGTQSYLGATAPGNLGAVTAAGSGFTNIRNFQSGAGGSTAVLVGASQFIVADHCWEVGDAVVYESFGDSAVAPLVSGTTYYVIPGDGSGGFPYDNIQLASSPEDAATGTFIPLVGTGGGQFHRFFSPRVLFGPSLVGSITNATGTIAVGMGVTAVSTAATPVNQTTIPDFTKVTSIVDMSAEARANAAGYKYRVAVDGIMQAVGTSSSTAVTVTMNRIRAGAFSNGTTVYTDSTAGIAVGMKLDLGTNAAFSGTEAGVLANDTIVTAVAGDGKSFTISSSPSTNIKNARVIAGTGSSQVTPTTIFTSDTTGLVVGMCLNVDSSSGSGGAGALTAITDLDANTVTRVTSISTYSFTVSRAASTALKAAKVSAGAASAPNITGSQSRVYLYSTDNIQKGMFIKVDAGTGLAFNQVANTATAGVVNVINPTEKWVSLATGTTIWNATPTAFDITTPLASAAVSFGANSDAADKVFLPSVSGINTGMALTLNSASSGTLQVGTTIIAVDPALRSIQLSATPAVAVVGGSFTGTIADGIIEGLYVTSNEPNFPEGAFVTDVTGTTITINIPHGGVRSGQSVSFSPFAEGTQISTITADAVNGTNIVLNQAHGGILGGTNVEFRKLPDNTYLSSIANYAATNWDLTLTPKNPIGSAIVVDTGTANDRPLSYNFVGSDKNLGSITDFNTNGTHIFTRSSNADGVYTVEAIPEPNKFVVRTDGFIPFNTKSFLDSNVNYTESYIYIASHKFRDGTSLIYRAGSADPIPCLAYTDADGIEQTTLVDGVTYYAVVVDPNYIKLAISFDAAVSDTPTTISFDSGATPMQGQQSFDTYSILGLTTGEGRIQVTEESDIVIGIGTKFLTNFKGGDVFRFYTAANPGLIFSYLVSSVKSDTSMKLQQAVPTNGTVSFNTITNRTVTGTAVTVGTQTITVNSSAGLAVGYQISDALGIYFPASTRITAINGNVLSLDKYLLINVPANTAVQILPLFQYFINTNMYVKSNAVTTHRPFDGGVSMTTGLAPDSTITRQTRRYFRYQSGKGIQCSMAINFNPPNDIEELSSNGNIAKVKVDIPHGFNSGSTNRIRITEAETPSGHNGYNGEFQIQEVIDDYTFTYVYEDTGLIGKVSDGSSTITNVASFTDIEVGKILKPGTYAGITVPENCFITAINQTARTVTVDKNLTGDTSFVSIDTINRINNVTVVVTDTAHNLATGEFISVQDVSTSGLNANYAQVRVLDSTTFEFDSNAVDASDVGGSVYILTRITAYRQNGSSISYGFPKYNLKSWQDASIRAGMFDTQNGMFFEYDGNQLYCVRRSSVQQISGKSTATYRSSLVTGTNTKYTTQLSVGEFIVIRGMSYKVIGIDSDTQMYIQPEYRGSSLNNIIVTKTVDTRVPQHQWSLDKADGRGRSGYILDLNKIQMVYIDYSWYGAGKIRFGFKNAKGECVYFHEFKHNNSFTEAYMRSGNIPARYEVVTKGQPTFSPSLFHWGTSVIMDGRFDDDKAYLFTADSDVVSLTNGSVAILQGAAGYGARRNTNYFTIALADASKYTKGGTVIYVTSYTSATVYQLDTFNQALPANTVITGVDLSIGNNLARVYMSNNWRNDYNVTSTTFIRVAVGGGSSARSIADLAPIPLVSVRLAPSVDNGLSGGLGFRDIINRMQLTLDSCGVLVSHESEVRLYLNGELSDSAFINNQSPSLSQLYRHKPGETVKNGILLFSFRATGGTQTTSGKRTLVQTSQDLGEVATLGNSILGGDEVFPNGPDILTITATPIDTSTITAAEPYQASARITWSESQA